MGRSATNVALLLILYICLTAVTRHVLGAARPIYMLDGYCDVERAAYLSSVNVIVQILVGVRVWHACRVASYNVEVGSC